MFAVACCGRHAVDAATVSIAHVDGNRKETTNKSYAACMDVFIPLENTLRRCAMRARVRVLVYLCVFISISTTIQLQPTLIQTDRYR